MGVGGLADGARPGAEGRAGAGGRRAGTADRWARRAKTSEALALRARIVLACAEGSDNKAVAARLRVSEHTVARWRGRFTRGRLDGLADEPRPGSPRRCCWTRSKRSSPRPGGSARDATHWYRASMARRSGVSKSTVGRIGASSTSSRTSATGSSCPQTAVRGEGRGRRGLYHDPPTRQWSLREREVPGPGLDRSAVLPMMPGMPSAAPMTTCGTASPACSPPPASPTAP